MLIGPPGGKKIDDRYPFVDRTGVISGHDVHAVKAPAVEPDRPLGVFQCHPAGGFKATAVDCERAALDRDGTGFVGFRFAVEFLFAVGKLALDRDPVVDGECAAAHGDRGSIIHSVDRAPARDGERAGPHVNDRHCIIVRIADVGMGDGMPVQVQCNIDVVYKLDLTRIAGPFFILLQIHVVQQRDGGGARLFC